MKNTTTYIIERKKDLAPSQLMENFVSNLERLGVLKLEFDVPLTTRDILTTTAPVEISSDGLRYKFIASSIFHSRALLQHQGESFSEKFFSFLFRNGKVIIRYSPYSSNELYSAVLKTITTIEPTRVVNVKPSRYCSFHSSLMYERRLRNIESLLSPNSTYPYDKLSTTWSAYDKKYNTVVIFNEQNIPTEVQKTTWNPT